MKFKSANCCECERGTLFDGEKCIPIDKCTCVDEAGKLRKSTEKWTDTKNPDCISHLCIKNSIETIDSSKDCSEILKCKEVIEINMRLYIR